MPKSKRNKTVDLSKTKKHGLEGKKELYKKIQSNLEDYAHVFVFAVNDMRNSKMKNVREQWKHSRFCIGKNKVMAMALGRIPEEEYRPNLHQIGQMLIGERGLLFTNRSIDEVINWFQSYSEGDFARSGNLATEDVTLPEGPLAQFPHNLESYLRQLGLPTTLKKGVIHLIKEHVVCTEGDRLSPETARILKLLGYEMAEFRIKILSVWSQDGSFVDLQSDSYNPESKENARKSFIRADFELPKDCLLLGSDDEMEIAENNPVGKNKISNNSNKGKADLEEEIEEPKIMKQLTPNPVGKNKISNNSTKEKEDLEEEIEEPKIMKQLTPKGKKSLLKADKPEQAKSNFVKNKSKSAQGKQTDVVETSENNTNSEEIVLENDVKISSPTKQIETGNTDMEVEEPEVKKPKNDSTVKKSGRKTKKTVEKQAAKEQTGGEVIINEKMSANEEIVDKAALLKLTEKKLEESAEKPKKFSPKMTRARAAAANKKIKTPEPVESKRNTRKRKM